MAISHKDHDHSNTPAARAACRKKMADGLVTQSNNAVQGMRKLAEAAGLVKPAQIVKVEPMGRGSGRYKNTDPKTGPRRMKVSGTLIKAEHDLADVPHVFADTIREAWGRDWDVQVGHPFNEVERRIVISGEVGTVQLVWSSAFDKVRTGVFVRSFDSSITRKVSNGPEGLELVADPENWLWRNEEGRCL